MDQSTKEKISQFLSQCNYTEAARICHEQLKDNPDDLSSGWMLGVILLLQEKNEEATCLFFEIIANNNPEANLQITETLTWDLVIFLEQAAVESLSSNRFRDAELLYRQILELIPAHHAALINLSMLMRITFHYTAALEFIEQVLSIHENSYIAYLEMARTYQGMGQPVAAVNALKKSLLIKPDHPPTHQLLREIQMSSAAKWHYLMMNDLERNLAYQKAIEAAVDHNSVVFEIGTGSGLLAMMAARAGAARVITCESNEMIAAKAQSIIQRNGYQDKIQVITSHSNSLKPETLGVSPDVIVHEIFGMNLVDEGVISALDHTLTKLAHPQAKLIPASATFWARLIECDSLRKQILVDKVCNFDLSLFNEFSWPYIIKSQVDNYSYRWLSPLVRVADIDFTKIPFQAVDKVIELPVTQAGNCHGVCYWFDLYLNEQIILTSGPKQQNKYQASHWGQIAQLFEPCFYVSVDQILRFQFQLTSQLLTMSYLPSSGNAESGIYCY
ncbi:MAG: tetratricopeptide repeat protein [Synechococcaceae cyanobacterium SM2_3_1]|nr:tetratricopeptide repeat protein [Synechococcaceae cyanobacterium SM2_3_1]